MATNVRNSAFVSLVTIGLLAAASLVEAQDPARKARKALREYSNAIGDLPEDTRRGEGADHKPGTPSAPPGKGWREEEFRVEDLHPRELGVDFVRNGPGLIVDRLQPRSAMAKLGFREGDRILAVDGHRVRSDKDFLQYIFAEDIRWGKVDIAFVRHDEKTELTVVPSKILTSLNPTRKDPLARLGLTMGDRAGNKLRIAEVLPQSAAATAGLRRGDEILAFDGEEVESIGHLRRLLADSPTGVYVVQVERGEATPKYKLEVVHGPGTFDRELVPLR